MDSLSDALSGLRAAQLRVDVAAGNVANMSTPGYQPSEVEQAAQPGGGVSASVVPGPVPANLPGVAPADQPSGTDLIEEMATLIAAPIAYTANARVVDASTEMTRNLLDVFA